jgi:hypothetical protein
MWSMVADCAILLVTETLASRLICRARRVTWEVSIDKAAVGAVGSARRQVRHHSRPEYKNDETPTISHILSQRTGSRQLHLEVW